MTKEQFLHDLDVALRKLPQNEREEVLQDITEHFTIGMAEGKNETEIIAALGSPEHIAKEMIAIYRVEKMETKASAGNIFRAVWAVIGLGFFNLVIVLGPLIGILGIIVGGWISSIAFIASPLIVFMNLFMYPNTFEWFDLFVTIWMCGLGLLIAIGMYYITRVMIQGLVRYLKYNINLVKGGLKHD